MVPNRGVVPGNGTLAVPYGGFPGCRERPVCRSQTLQISGLSHSSVTAGYRYVEGGSRPSPTVWTNGIPDSPVGGWVRVGTWYRKGQPGRRPLQFSKMLCVGWGHDPTDTVSFPALVCWFHTGVPPEPTCRPQICNLVGGVRKRPTKGTVGFADSPALFFDRLE